MKNLVKSDIETIRIKSNPILRQYPVKRAGLFGSVAGGENNSKSDIDILIEFENEKITYNEYYEIIRKLEDAFGKEVDLVQYKLIKPIIKEYILSTEIPIYEKN